MIDNNNNEQRHVDILVGLEWVVLMASCTHLHTHAYKQVVLTPILAVKQINGPNNKPDKLLPYWPTEVGT